MKRAAITLHSSGCFAVTFLCVLGCCAAGECCCDSTFFFFFSILFYRRRYLTILFKKKKLQLDRNPNPRGRNPVWCSYGTRSHSRRHSGTRSTSSAVSTSRRRSSYGGTGHSTRRSGYSWTPEATPVARPPSTLCTLTTRARPATTGVSLSTVRQYLPLLITTENYFTDAS